MKSSQKCLSCFSDLIDTLQEKFVHNLTLTYDSSMKVESGEDLQHYHLRRGVHSRSLHAPQVGPSRAFATPPSSSVLIQIVPEFAMLPCACAGSLKAPRDLTSLPLRSFSMQEHSAV